MSTSVVEKQNGRGLLHLSTAHGVKGGKDHSDRENPRS